MLLSENVSASKATPSASETALSTGFNKSKAKTSKPDSVMTHRGMMSVPLGKQSNTFNAFVDLPINNPHCDRVDMVNGMWYHCSLCDIKVKGRKGRSWTMSRWDEHTAKDSPHDERAKNVDSIAGIREKKKSGKVRRATITIH